MIKNHAGFAAIGTVFAMIGITTIGFAGNIAFQAHSHAEGQVAAALPAQSEWVTYASRVEPGISFKYPATWKITKNTSLSDDVSETFVVTAPGSDIGVEWAAHIDPGASNCDPVIAGESTSLKRLMPCTLYKVHNVTPIASSQYSVVSGVYSTKVDGSSAYAAIQAHEGVVSTRRTFTGVFNDGTSGKIALIAGRIDTSRPVALKPDIQSDLSATLASQDMQTAKQILGTFSRR